MFTPPVLRQVEDADLAMVVMDHDDEDCPF